MPSYGSGEPVPLTCFSVPRYLIDVLVRLQLRFLSLAVTVSACAPPSTTTWACRQHPDPFPIKGYHGMGSDPTCTDHPQLARPSLGQAMEDGSRAAVHSAAQAVVVDDVYLEVTPGHGAPSGAQAVAGVTLGGAAPVRRRGRPRLAGVCPCRNANLGPQNSTTFLCLAPRSPLLPHRAPRTSFARYNLKCVHVWVCAFAPSTALCSARLTIAAVACCCCFLFCRPPRHHAQALCPG
jgi:hypothetical protein